MKKQTIFILSVVLLAGMISCQQQPANNSGSEGQEEKEKKVQPVKTMTLEKQTIKRTVETTASLEAFEETYLAPAISGKIRSIYVDVDDRVKRGKVLVKMDETQLQQTRVQYENLKKDLRRMDTLLDYGSVTRQAFDQLETQVEVTAASMENLEENTTLKAPYNGVITGKFFNEGELFSPTPNTQAGKAAILSLVKMDVLKVYINLSERYLPLVKEGHAALIHTNVYPADTLRARVRTIYPTINPATRTFRVELYLENPDYRLRPGMFSTVTLEMGDRNALLVPAIAVLKQAGTNNRYIFVNDNGKAIKKTVQLGERLDDKLELITNGVKEGDELIYAGHVNLMDGDPVKVISE